MHQYDDIIYLPHHVSDKRIPMSMVDRGAQFSPFAALTGYEAVLQESARQTEMPAELTESAIASLNEILQQLCDRIENQPWASYLCYVPDEKKPGGSCIRIAGSLKKYDSLQNCLILTDGRIVPVESIRAIETK